MKQARLLLYILLALPSISSAIDNKYQQCYDITISADIKSCMSDKYSESIGNLEKEHNAFIERSHNNVLEERYFANKTKKEHTSWKIYIQNKCQMEASADTILDSFSYWIEYYKCSSVEADKKAEYYKNYNFY